MNEGYISGVGATSCPLGEAEHRCSGTENMDMHAPERGRLIFTSQGLNTKLGAQLICGELQGDELLSQSTILVVLEKNPIQAMRQAVINACVAMGFEQDNIICSDATVLPETVDYIYVTDGNTFEILRHLQKEKSHPQSEGLMPYIRRNVARGATYIGASAGAMLAGVDVKLALEFDKNRYGITDFTGLGLFRGTVIPHYTKKDLSRFITNSTEEELSGYENIYHVEDGGVLCL